MAKLKQNIKLEIESANGSWIDLSDNWRDVCIYDADGHVIESFTNPIPLQKLDEKYKAVLEKIVSETK